MCEETFAIVGEGEGRRRWDERSRSTNEERREVSAQKERGRGRIEEVRDGGRSGEGWEEVEGGEEGRFFLTSRVRERVVDGGKEATDELSSNRSSSRERSFQLNLQPSRSHFPISLLSARIHLLFDFRFLDFAKKSSMDQQEMDEVELE